MNIQIFGTKKCNDTKKAQRFFKERGIKFQFIDMLDKGMSKGEFQSVAKAHGGIDGMINPDCKDKDALARVNYMADKLLQQLPTDTMDVSEISLLRSDRGKNGMIYTRIRNIAAEE